MARAGRATVEPDDDVMDPIQHIRRAKKAARDDAAWREVNSDDFADLAHAYAHSRGLDPDDVLEEAKDAARQGKRVDPGLRAFIDAQGASEADGDHASDTFGGVGKGGRRPAAGATRRAPARRPGKASSGSGFLLGVVGYGVVINWVRYGPGGVRDWLKAKLINQPSTSYTPPPKVSQAAGIGGTS